MKSWGWWIIWTVVVLMVVILIAWEVTRPAATVEVAIAQQGTIQEFVDERAITRLPRTYLITMPYPGRISEITLREGDKVYAGQVVAKIVPEDLELAVKSATAAVERLDASIAENADTSLEQLIKRQAEQYVASMENAVAAAAKQVESSKAKLEYAVANLRRFESLYASGAATEDELDRARLQEVEARLEYAQNQLLHSTLVALKAATDYIPAIVDRYIEERAFTDAVLKAQRAQAETQLQKARLDQQRGIFRSPVDGLILHRYVADERFLPAGQPLLEIGRLEDLEIEADILTTDATRITKGANVLIYGPAIGSSLPGDRNFARGKVSRIFPAAFTKISSLGVEQQRVKIIVEFDKKDLLWLLTNRNLGVGYRLRVRIITAEKKEAIILPRSCLTRDAEGNWLAYVVSNGRIEIRPVDVGLSNDLLTEVKAGVSRGETVVLNPEPELKPGTRVAVDRTISPPLDVAQQLRFWSGD